MQVVSVIYWKCYTICGNIVQAVISIYRDPANGCRMQGGIRMSTEIYYFSGTGNSLFAAKELQKRLPGSRLMPIAGLLQKDGVKTEGKAAGLIFPVHALTIPIAVKRFIRMTDFESADYIFAVATRLGTVFRGFEEIDRLLKKKGKRLSAGYIINLGNNEARHENYAVPAPAELLALETAALKRLAAIAAAAEKREISREKDTECTVGFGKGNIVDFLLEKTVLSGMALSEHIGGVQYFYADPACTGCGICEKVCLSGKISMKDGKPVWNKKVLCYMCFACLNFCPARAVQSKDIPGVKSYTKQNGRYPHPYAAVNDIAAQKRRQ